LSLLSLRRARKSYKLCAVIAEPLGDHIKKNKKQKAKQISL
jgi:hypothetical protein